MRIFDFSKKFQDEETCRRYFKTKREERGITCKCCKGTKHYWFEKQGLWKCANCGSRTNLRAGTIMEQSNLPFYYWYATMHLITTTKKTISALELQKQLGHKRYEPIWYMMHKIRIVMGRRDKKYKLQGNIEMDEGFFEVVNFDMVKGEKLKAGRGSQKQLPVLVIAEFTPLTEQELKTKTNKHTPNTKIRYIKMITIDTTSENSINYEVGKGVDNNATAHTDGWTGYKNLYTLVDSHNKMVVKKKEAHKKLPWVHTIISNAKKKFLGFHHSIGKNYLQNYLNEFVYKFNRRYLGEDDDIFDRLLDAGFDGCWNK